MSKVDFFFVSSGHVDETKRPSKILYTWTEFFKRILVTIRRVGGYGSGFDRIIFVQIKAQTLCHLAEVDGINAIWLFDDRNDGWLAMTKERPVDRLEPRLLFYISCSCSTSQSFVFVFMQQLSNQTSARVGDAVIMIRWWTSGELDFQL